VPSAPFFAQRRVGDDRDRHIERETLYGRASGTYATSLVSVPRAIRPAPRKRGPYEPSRPAPGARHLSPTIRLACDILHTPSIRDTNCRLTG